MPPELSNSVQWSLPLNLIIWDVVNHNLRLVWTQFTSCTHQARQKILNLIDRSQVRLSDSDSSLDLKSFSATFRALTTDWDEVERTSRDLENLNSPRLPPVYRTHRLRVHYLDTSLPSHLCQNPNRKNNRNDASYSFIHSNVSLGTFALVLLLDVSSVRRKFFLYRLSLFVPVRPRLPSSSFFPVSSESDSESAPATTKRITRLHLGDDTQFATCTVDERARRTTLELERRLVLKSRCVPPAGDSLV
ncbi:hypothetical protein B0H12DRAFT_1074094 [Mycena haematopus]|nr:hypothetical protein B0H12DRAFT_1074094 [Mycena haematopus]